MEEIIQHLENAHNAAKNLAVDAIQNDREIEQYVLDTIKAIGAVKAAVKQAAGQ